MDIAVDVISQKELRTIWDLFELRERVSAHIARRIALGATVEPGDYSAEPMGSLDEITGEVDTPGSRCVGFTTCFLSVDRKPQPAAA